MKHPAIACAHGLHLLGSACLVLSALLISTADALDDDLLVYVGTYTGTGSKGIYAFRFNTTTGESRSLALAAVTDNPSFLAVGQEGRHLYAVNEIDTFRGRPVGAVSVFSIEPGSGALKFQQQVSSLGRGPAHVSLDRSGRFLLVANYGGGNVAVFPIRRDGLLDYHSAFMQASGSSVNKARQEAPHAHFIQVSPDNRFAMVADLGIDKLLVYDFDSHKGTLGADASRARTLAPGAGPRHFAFTPSGKYLFVANELTSSVTQFAYDAETGRLEMRQTVSTLPGGFTGTNTTAEIIVDPQGRYLYVSNRGDDSIVVFEIDAGTGRLSFAQRVECGGKSPRHITLDPTGRWLFSANQNSDRINFFKVSPDDGRLTPTSRSASIVRPVCITFAWTHKPSR